MQTKKQTWADRLKRRNKLGFSLVELIVIIAMMAVLTAVLAPALLSYTERSRAQKDVSAMDEATNAVFLSLADMSVYDELVANSLPENVSCYIDTNDENDHLAYREVTKQAIGDSLEKYIFNDNARQQDEVKYYAAGNMRGVTITFSPNPSSNESGYVLAEGVVNGFLTDGTTKLVDLPLVYNAMRQVMGDVIKLTSQTYRNSDYTIFIKIGSTGGGQANAQDAIEAYGQYSGTNLPMDDIKYYVACNRKVSDPELGIDPANKVPVMLNGAGQVFDKAEPETLMFRSSAPIDEFQNVVVNGEIVDPQYYTVREGSTIVELMISYLKSLNVDTYTIAIVSNNGAPSVTFSVVNTCTHANTELVNVQNATCVSVGYSGDTACSACGKTLATGSETPKSDVHTFTSATDLKCDLCDRAFTSYTFTSASAFDTATGSNMAQSAHIVIPETFQHSNGTWYKVTAISNSYTSAFAGNTQLVSIVIPKSVVTIDKQSFDGCSNLETVVIEEGSQLTTIGNYAFRNCKKLKGINLPSTVTTMGSYAFYSCSALESINIPASLNTIDIYTFYYCKGLKTVTFDANSQLTSIGKEAFRYSGVTSLVLPANLKTIANAAFRDCTSLTTVSFESGSKLETMDNSAFYTCSQLTTFTIPASLKSMGKSMFMNTSLSYVIVEDPTGWSYASSATATTKTAIDASLLMDPTTAAATIKSNSNYNYVFHEVGE